MARVAYWPKCLFVFICLSLYSLIVSCAKDVFIIEVEPDTTSQEAQAPFSITEIKKIEEGIDGFCRYNGKLYSAQGVAISNQILYRLYDTGVCRTYDVHNLENPVFLSCFELGSHNSDNHSNCAQFWNDPSEGLLLYVAGLKGKCFVERVSMDSSSLLQTITLPPLALFCNSQSLNIICGEDGFLWAFGDSRQDNKLFIAKIRRPDVKDGDVELTVSDILQVRVFDGYIYNESPWQGGMVYGGYLFFVFGSKGAKRRIIVFDTTQFKIVNDIDLMSIVSEEPEDCDLCDGKVLLTICGENGYYLLDTK